ncbi:Crp/Fnr family transcriptional regulator [Mucilaginibacter lutimaris]|uniref:Crp/Fnr family transcriptional regulator n=1 Tax=Mucilaginibacter lutimaris TaxID=931629 RepID=A0ABW2ZED8_9SPHI
MFENILSHIGKCITLTDEERKIFTGFLEPRTVKKKTFLLRQGEVCQFEGYIEKGCARIYYVDLNGHEVILSFATEDWWLGDIASFNEQKPTRFFIETLEDTDMYILTPQTKEQLLARVPKFERVFRILVQRNLSVTQNRLINNMAMPASERYLEFIRTYPSVPLRVAQYHIASYLGVTPEFVSTIRKRLAAK